MPPKSKSTENDKSSEQVTNTETTPTEQSKPVEPKPTQPEPVEPTDVTADDQPTVSEELVTDVLMGRWGSYNGLRDRLTEAGHNPTDVLTRVNERLANGAPSAYRPSALDIAEQIQNGEWGTEETLRQRLEGAGFSSGDTLSVLKRGSK